MCPFLGWRCWLPNVMADARAVTSSAEMVPTKKVSDLANP